MMQSHVLEEWRSRDVEQKLRGLKADFMSLVGKRLSELLDEDQWAEREALLIAAVKGHKC